MACEDRWPAWVTDAEFRAADLGNDGHQWTAGWTGSSVESRPAVRGSASSRVPAAGALAPAGQPAETVDAPLIRLRLRASPGTRPTSCFWQTFRGMRRSMSFIHEPRPWLPTESDRFPEVSHPHSENTPFHGASSCADWRPPRPRRAIQKRGGVTFTRHPTHRFAGRCRSCPMSSAHPLHLRDTRYRPARLRRSRIRETGTRSVHKAKICQSHPNMGGRGR